MEEDVQQLKDALLEATGAIQEQAKLIQCQEERIQALEGSLQEAGLIDEEESNGGEPDAITPGYY